MKISRSMFDAKSNDFAQVFFDILEKSYHVKFQRKKSLYKDLKMEWINIADELPPKDKPFLAKWAEGEQKMEWKKHLGSYGDLECNRGSTSAIQYWQRLPDQE